MGYNPDENADGLIGVSDLAGLLALYGNPFDNSDSTVVEYLEFPELNGEADTVFISENADIIYVSSANHQGLQAVVLPAGNSWKTIVAICYMTDPLYSGAATGFDFHRPAHPVFDSQNGSCLNGLCNMGQVGAFNGQRFFLPLIRDHQGVWSAPAGTIQ